MGGREQLIDSLIKSLEAGHATLLYGSVGAGKTAVLRAIARRTGRCAFAERTGSRTDVTAALSVSPAANILLLDGLVRATAPMRRFLHWLQG